MGQCDRVGGGGGLALAEAGDKVEEGGEEGGVVGHVGHVDVVIERPAEEGDGEMGL